MKNFKATEVESRSGHPPPAEEAEGSDPTVSIIIPCRNEGEHIEKCLQSVLSQALPVGGFEVLVSDGMSVDGTRKLLHQLAEEDPRLRIIDNPARITPCAMNAGIRAARGRYIAIMGAHTEYARDYIQKCVALLEAHPEVCCTGGPIISRGNSDFGRSVALAMSHPVGVGNAKHRFPHYEGYAEGACFPVFRRETFDMLGLYDEKLVRNQDDDLNFRLARLGGRVFISPEARCVYFVRETPGQLFRQYFQYGYWRVAVLRKHHMSASLRQLIPVTFFALAFSLLIGSLWLHGGGRLIGAILPIVYALVLSVASLGVAAKEGMHIGFMFFMATAMMHTAYAGGFMLGLCRGKRMHPGTKMPVAKRGTYESRT